MSARVNAGNESSLRIPILTRVGIGFPLGMGALFLLFGISELPLFGQKGEFEMAILLGLSSAVMVWLPVSQAIRYRGTVLVVDSIGIGLERKGERHGLSWDKVRGYERKPGKVIVLGADGESLKLPHRPLEEYPAALYQILDRHIGPDGERIAPPRPTDPVLAKVHDYYGKVPPVEMEPDVVYRQGNCAELKRQSVSDSLQAGLALFGGLVLLLLALRTPVAMAIVLPVGTVVFAAGLVSFGLSLRKMRLTEDRLVLRDRAVYRVRNGKEYRLPSPQPVSTKTFHGQPITRYGTGPFAYEVSHQFLEPDA